MHRRRWQRLQRRTRLRERARAIINGDQLADRSLMKNGVNELHVSLSLSGLSALTATQNDNDAGSCAADSIGTGNYDGNRFLVFMRVKRNATLQQRAHARA